MDTPLILKIVHMSSVTLLFIVILARGLTLFKNTQENQPSIAKRKLFVAIQHATLTILAITGLVLLYLKDFKVETWFYAKIILFLVMLSSLIKAYKKDENILLVQRRAGWVIALVALSSIVVLVMIKPNFG